MTSPQRFSREHLSQFQVFRNILTDPVGALFRQCEVSNLSEGEVSLEKAQGRDRIVTSA